MHPINLLQVPLGCVTPFALVNESARYTSFLSSGPNAWLSLWCLLWIFKLCIEIVPFCSREGVFLCCQIKDLKLKNAVSSIRCQMTCQLVRDQNMWTFFKLNKHSLYQLDFENWVTKSGIAQRIFIGQLQCLAGKNRLMLRIWRDLLIVYGRG